MARLHLKWPSAGFAVIFASLLVFGAHASSLHQQTRFEALQTELKDRYASIQDQFANPPKSHEEIPPWQVELARRFAQAADTVEEIIKTNHPQSEMWRERLETLRLYAQPISSPNNRTVYGAGEVEKRAHVLDAPAATYTDAARAAKVIGNVRLRMVLASDGTVKYIFPIKSLGYGLAETAMEAARQIKFEPAVRNGQPASQFVTFVYEFRNERSFPPYIPRTIF